MVKEIKSTLKFPLQFAKNIILYIYFIEKSYTYQKYGIYNNNIIQHNIIIIHNQNNHEVNQNE